MHLIHLVVRPYSVARRLVAQWHEPRMRCRCARTERKKLWVNDTCAVESVQLLAGSEFALDAL